MKQETIQKLLQDNLASVKILKWKELSGLEKYFYIKQCWGNIHGDLTMPLSIIDKVLLGGIFLKVFGIQSIWFLIPLGIASTIILIFLGHLKFKHKFASIELSVQNRFNPELMKILDNSDVKK